MSIVAPIAFPSDKDLAKHAGKECGNLWQEDKKKNVNAENSNEWQNGNGDPLNGNLCQGRNDVKIEAKWWE